VSHFYTGKERKGKRTGVGKGRGGKQERRSRGIGKESGGS